MSTRATLVLFVLFALVAGGCRGSGSDPSGIGQPMTSAQSKNVTDAIALMRKKGLSTWADQATTLAKAGKWKAAKTNDPYLTASEKAGDTPFAYTLPDDKHPHSPIEIVLAPRFFTDADTTAEAALMIHEMGHWRAFVKNGSSTEYDGYKVEYDTHDQLGLGESDGLAYWAMLDGVEQYVVPRAPAYKNYPDEKAYIEQSG
jgi:hypothetical protein